MLNLLCTWISRIPNKVYEIKINESTGEQTIRKSEKDEIKKMKRDGIKINKHTKYIINISD